MNKRGFAVLTVAAVALLVAGGLFASNMGFKLNLALDSPAFNGSATGLQDVALPFNQQTSLVSAIDIRADINATVPGAFKDVSRFVKQTDLLVTYAGLSSFPAVGNTDFNLVPGEGIRIKVQAPVNYIIVGSHDPGLVVTLDAPGSNGSATGLQDYAYPYHSTAADAIQLRDEINAQAGNPNAVKDIAVFVRSNDSLVTYAGLSNFPAVGNTNFPLTPGTAYRVKIRPVNEGGVASVPYVPSHY